MTTLYTAKATAVGGRNGHAETEDGSLKFDMASPGGTKKGTNPEQLFACGYAACFGSAVEHVARQQKLTPGEVTVQSSVKLNQDDSGFSLAVVLDVSVAGLDAAAAQKLVEAAHQVCPYSKATRGNIAVELRVNHQPLAKAA